MTVEFSASSRSAPSCNGVSMRSSYSVDIVLTLSERASFISDRLKSPSLKSNSRQHESSLPYRQFGPRTSAVMNSLGLFVENSIRQSDHLLAQFGKSLGRFG